MPAPRQRPDQSRAARPDRRAALLRFGAALLAAGAPALLTPRRVEAAPSARLLDEAWTRSGAADDPDAGPWAAFLANWTRPGGDGIMRVDYRGALAAGALDGLSAWLGAMQAVDPTTLGRDAAMAYWINLYNAKTVELILTHYPVDSIREVEGGLFDTGPWDEDVLAVNGAALSLNDVEHGILRPIWRDPRIHYAVNCASLGCPNLKPTPWGAATLEADLDAAARAYVNHPRGARLESGRLIVSKIYDWYEADFGGTEAGVIAHLALWAEPAFRNALSGVTEVSGTDYDWALNAA